MNWYKKAREDVDIEEDVGWVDDIWTSVESSWIDAVAYFEPMGGLDVRLKNGKTYGFIGVPKQVYDDFMESTSKGEFFNRVIKNRYKRDKS
jgi:hypothetical protein